MHYQKLIVLIFKLHILTQNVIKNRKRNMQLTQIKMIPCLSNINPGQPVSGDLRTGEQFTNISACFTCLQL